jgi:hypothetical protein
MPEDPKSWTIWKHLKTGGTYTVIGVATCSTNGRQNDEKGVVYQNHTEGRIFYRKLEEFMDGRFVQIH